MWFTPRRAEGVRSLAYAVILIVAFALAITFNVNGWKSVHPSDITSPMGFIPIVTISWLIFSGIIKLR